MGRKKTIFKDPVWRDVGLKLLIFRKQLAVKLNQKKITQGEFGAMFGGYSNRQIQSYENGEVEIPARLLYLIFREGYSVDGLFCDDLAAHDAHKSGSGQRRTNNDV